MQGYNTYFFFLQDSILHTLSPSCSFSAKATVETATAALDCGADGAAQDADFSAGLSFGMDLPKTITTLQRNCPTKTRAPHCQVMRGLCGHIYSFIYPPTLIVCHDRWKQLRIGQSYMERFNADYVAYENFFIYNTYVIRFRKRNEEFRKRNFYSLQFVHVDVSNETYVGK